MNDVSKTRIINHHLWGDVVIHRCQEDFLKRKDTFVSHVHVCIEEEAWGEITYVMPSS